MTKEKRNEYMKARYHRLHPDAKYYEKKTDEEKKAYACSATKRYMEKIKATNPEKYAEYKRKWHERYMKNREKQLLYQKEKYYQKKLKEKDV